MERHDNDNHHPRSPSHIYESNKVIRDKFYDIFKHEDPLYPLTIPIVPSYGNNDVWPYEYILSLLM
jgi:endopolyphosphatase